MDPSPDGALGMACPVHTKSTVTGGLRCNNLPLSWPLVLDIEKDRPPHCATHHYTSSQRIQQRFVLGVNYQTRKGNKKPKRDIQRQIIVLYIDL